VGPRHANGKIVYSLAKRLEIAGATEAGIVANLAHSGLTLVQLVSAVTAGSRLEQLEELFVIQIGQVMLLHRTCGHLSLIADVRHLVHTRFVGHFVYAFENLPPDIVANGVSLFSFT